MTEHPPDAILLRVNLQPRPEIIRDEATLKGHKAEDIPFMLVQRQRGTVKRHDATERLGNGVEKGLRRQARNHGVIDFKQRAVSLRSGC